MAVRFHRASRVHVAGLLCAIAKAHFVELDMVHRREYRMRSRTVQRQRNPCKY